MKWTEAAGKLLWFESRRGTGSATVRPHVIRETPCCYPSSTRRRRCAASSGWMLADKTLPPTEAEARCLRLYTVYYPEGGTEELDEHDVARLVRVVAWQAAAA